MPSIQNSVRLLYFVTLPQTKHNLITIEVSDKVIIMKNISKGVFILMVAAVMMLSGVANAGGKHKVVIQVSTDDARTQKIALNNAVNIQKFYGMDHVDVEIVAYGPGLGLMTVKSKLADRVKSLAMQNISFSACQNTMKKIQKKKGKLPKLTEGVSVTPSGTIRIMELQEQGYSYIRP